MLSQPATKIFLRTTEPRAAKWVSEAIGEIEIERLRETHYDGSRAGKNFALDRQTEPLVLPPNVSPRSCQTDVVCCVKTSLPQIGIVLGAELSLFPHDILRLLVISQSNEFRMPEMAHIGPLHKLKLPYKLRL